MCVLDRPQSKRSPSSVGPFFLVYTRETARSKTRFWGGMSLNRPPVHVLSALFREGVHPSSVIFVVLPDNKEVREKTPPLVFILSLGSLHTANSSCGGDRGRSHHEV